MRDYLGPYVCRLQVHPRHRSEGEDGLEMPPQEREWQTHRLQYYHCAAFIWFTSWNEQVSCGLSVLHRSFMRSASKSGKSRGLPRRTGLLVRRNPKAPTLFTREITEDLEGEPRCFKVQCAINREKKNELASRGQPCSTVWKRAPRGESSRGTCGIALGRDDQNM